MGLVLGLEPLAPVGVAVRAARDLGQEDRRLGRFALREDDAVLASRVGPVLEQLAGDRRDAGVLTVPAPLLDVAPDLVDQLVPLAAFAGDVEVDRLLLEPSLPFLPFFVTAIGIKDSLGRRPSLISPVGPCGPIS